jgi:hypothetical protein
LPLLDLDVKRFDYADGELYFFMFIQIFTCTIIQAGINFITKDIRYWIISVSFTCIVSNLGAYKMAYKDEDGLYTILIENKRAVAWMTTCFNTIIGLIFISYMLNFGEKEILKLWNQRNNMINKMESIFHSLQEAIITINVNGISFVNGHG